MKTMAMAVVLAVMTMGCQPRFHACQPIEASAFEYELSESASVETPDFGTISVTVVYQHENDRPIDATIVLDHIVHAMHSYQDAGMDLVVVSDWTVYVTSEDSAVWVNQEGFDSTLGCSITSQNMFPAFVEGEGQMVLTDFAWDASDVLVTVAHEVTHTLSYRSTGDADADHSDSMIWTNIR